MTYHGQSLCVTGGLFPIPGLTIVVCIILIWLFRLNPVVTQIFNLLVTPLELVMVVPFVKAGEKLFLAREAMSLSPQAFVSQLLEEGVWSSLEQFGARLGMACVAWLLFCTIASPILKLLCLPAVRLASRIYQRRMQPDP